MKLTGQCRDDFEKWFLLSDNRENFSDAVKIQVGHSILETFYKLPDSMQYGVLMDFFWGKKIPIPVKISMDKTSLEQAREEAIKAANDIYNEKS